MIVSDEVVNDLLTYIQNLDTLSIYDLTKRVRIVHHDHSVRAVMDKLAPHIVVDDTSKEVFLSKSGKSFIKKHSWSKKQEQLNLQFTFYRNIFLIASLFVSIIINILMYLRSLK